ncbi:MAG: uridine kinase [Halanaerobium sp.]|nr:uridine kinase [Halanaerobium sp.]
MFIVGVAGGTGSGKTTLARTLVKKLGREDVLLIPHDSYYRERSNLTLEERKKINYDHPDAFETDLLIEHLEKLRAGQPVEMPTYDYTLHTRADKTILLNPKPIAIVEGIVVLAEEELRRQFDIKVYVDTDPDIRVLRRIRRDILDRGRTIESVHKQYLTTVKPMHDAFIEPSKRYADIIIPEGGHNSVALSLLYSRLLEHLTQEKE